MRGIVRIAMMYPPAIFIVWATHQAWLAGGLLSAVGAFVLTFVPSVAWAGVVVWLVPVTDDERAQRKEPD